MIRLVMAMLVTAGLTASFQASAQNSGRTFADVYAECGIGAMLFNSSASASDSGRVLAIISNATWDWGTTAHSSNAFSEENCQGSAAAKAAFLFHSYEQIETDLAQGGGDHLDALLSELNCTVAKDEVVSGLRSSLGMAASQEATTQDSAGRIYDTLATMCTV